jgi:hypothetical protein
MTLLLVVYFSTPEKATTKSLTRSTHAFFISRFEVIISIVRRNFFIALNVAYASNGKCLSSAAKFCVGPTVMIDEASGTQ